MPYEKEDGPSQEYWERKRNQEIGMSVLKFLGALSDNISGTFAEKEQKSKESYNFWFNLLKSGESLKEEKE